MVCVFEVERPENSVCDRLAPHEEVPCNRHEWNYGKVLIDGGDTVIERIARAVEDRFLALEQNRAFVWRIDA